VVDRLRREEKPTEHEQREHREKDSEQDQDVTVSNEVGSWGCFVARIVRHDGLLFIASRCELHSHQ
jgi:hypothetical protein